MPSVSRGQYHYPSTDDFAARIHTNAGVKSLCEHSHLKRLLEDLEENGYDVGGAMAELIALLNYVTWVNATMQDMETHLAYCLDKTKKIKD